MTLTIDGTPVGTDERPFIIAEIGMNHNGDTELGKEMIQAAAKAGADAVKFQSFRTDEFLSEKIDTREEYRQYELSRADHEELQIEAQSNDITFISTPFDRTSVDMLSELGVPCFKIASSDLTNYPFLEYIAQKGKPMILSTGYSSLSEVARAVETVREAGNDNLVLLHCLSSYPAPPEEMNLKAIQTLHDSFDVLVGLSDHTQDSPVAPITATAFGASVLEKHFTIDNSLPGFDHGMSETPETFSRMVTHVKTTADALGAGDKQPHKSELKSRTGARRSLFWKSSYSTGTPINDEMMLAMRPGDGISPERIDTISKNELSIDVSEGEQVQYGQIRWSDE